MALLVALQNGDDGPKPFVASAGDGPATLLAVGDSADGGERPTRVAEMIERQRPDRLLYLGDVYERGTHEEWDEHYEPAFGRFASITAPTPGNHEWYLRDEGYRPY